MNRKFHKIEAVDCRDMKILLLAFPIFAVGMISIIYLEEIDVQTSVINNTLDYYEDDTSPILTSNDNWGSNWSFEHSCKGQEIFYGVFDIEFLSYCNV